MFTGCSHDQRFIVMAVYFSSSPTAFEGDAGQSDFNGKVPRIIGLESYVSKFTLY